MKKKNKNNIKAFATSSVLSCMIAGSAFADDIEIYTGSKGKETNVNILFMLDTSGSMDYDIEGSYETRMQQAKKALTKVIQELPGNMRVGLGRFNDPGGSILIPAKRLDDTIDSDISISADDDAIENRNDKNVNVEDEKLTFFNADTKNIEYSLSNGLSIASQCPTGYAFKKSPKNIKIGFVENYNCYPFTGFIINNVELDKNTEITGVQLDLLSSRYYVLDTISDFYYENTVKPESFSNKDIYTRKLEEFSAPPWDIKYNPYGVHFERYDGDALKEIFQKTINNKNWQRNASLNFYIRSPDWIKIPHWSGGFTYERNTTNLNLFNGVSNRLDYSPRINIQVKQPEDNIVGIKFSDINVPSQTNVKKGLLKLTASDNNGSGTITIRLQKGTHSQSFIEKDGDLSNRELINDSITLPYSNWTKGTIKLFDVSSLLERKFSHDWCGGGDVTFILESKDIKSVYSKDYGEKLNQIEKKPELILQYDGGNENSCVSSDGIYKISQSDDDSNERKVKNSFFEDLWGVETYKNEPYSSYMTLKDDNLGGLIFRDVNIPKGSKIKEAYLSLTAAESNQNKFDLELYINKPSNEIKPFNSEDKHLSNRLNKEFNEIEDWDINSGIKENVSYQTKNIAKYIQKIVDSNTFQNSSKKSIGFMLESDSNSPLKFYTYDHSESKAAKLIIRFDGSNKYQNRMQSFAVKNNNSKKTVRQYLLEVLKEQPSSGTTPMEGALYEAGQYFLGGAVDYGRSRNNNGGSTIPYKRISSEDTYTGGKVEFPAGCSKNNLTSWACGDIDISGNPIYTTPMTDKVCETNNIILITDGEPSSVGYSPYDYPRTQEDYFRVPLAKLIKKATGRLCRDAWSCAGDWVSYLYNTDFMPNKPGKSNVLTHIIGFTELDSENNLRLLARKGGGTFNSARNTEELVNSLSLVISNIMDIESTLATPGVAVNQNNRLQNLSDIYYSVFKPTAEKAWNGNLKKYRVDSKSSKIVDRFGVNAVNEDTGFFEKDTTSFWSQNPDGGDVLLGGAASLFNLNRNIYTCLDENPENVHLNSIKNRISGSNILLSNELFNLPESTTPVEKIRFLNWLSGIDVYDENQNGNYKEPRKIMGDPLHSRPVLINYDDNTNIVFVSTNDGLLHAINAENGKEKFSYVPKILLKNSYDIYLNGAGKHIYGLDSSWVAWRHDTNKDGKIRKEDGDWVYIYSGMRRGGDHFYALDVTDLNDPIVKFIKKPSENTPFENMGQTWSEPVLGKMKINGKETVVLIFGGGYDKGYDNPNYNNLYDSKGNQLFILNAETGKVITWLSGTNSKAPFKLQGMNYSIVSKPTIFDANNDGLIDYIYLTDLSSQIIKIKVNNNANKENLISSKIIARLGRSTGDRNPREHRMMFDSVAVAPVKNGNDRYLAIVAGTGYRAHPLDKVKNDIITVIKDKEDFSLNPVEIKNPILLRDLGDLTNKFNDNDINNALRHKLGYYIKLKEGDHYIGEKATGTPLIYDNQIIINTYVPNTKAGECSPVIGYARSYRMNVFNGKPINSAAIADGQLTHSDRYKDNITTGIANGSKLIYTEDGVYLLTNTKIEKIGKGGALGVHKKRWYEKK